MAHIVTADHAGAVGEPVRMRPVGRAQQQRRRIDRAAGNDDDVAAIALDLAVAMHDHLRHLAAGRIGLDALDIGAGQQGDVRVPQCRHHADDMRVGLGLHQTREPVAGGAADAGAVLRLVFVEHDADRQRERAVAGAFEIVRKLLDARLVRYRRVGIRVVAGRLGRVAAALYHGRDRAARPRCNTARDRGTTAAIPATCRRHGARRRNRARAIAAAPRRTSSYCRRPSSECRDGTACRRGRARSPAPCTGSRRTPLRCSNSAARAAGSRRVRGSGCACRTGPGDRRACRRRRRCR